MQIEKLIKELTELQKKYPKIEVMAWGRLEVYINDAIPEDGFIILDHRGDNKKVKEEKITAWVNNFDAKAQLLTDFTSLEGFVKNFMESLIDRGEGPKSAKTFLQEVYDEFGGTYMISYMEEDIKAAYKANYSRGKKKKGV